MGYFYSLISDQIITCRQVRVTTAVWSAVTFIILINYLETSNRLTVTVIPLKLRSVFVKLSLAEESGTLLIVTSHHLIWKFHLTIIAITVISCRTSNFELWGIDTHSAKLATFRLVKALHFVPVQVLNRWVHTLKVPPRYYRLHVFAGRKGRVSGHNKVSFWRWRERALET